MKVLHLFVAFLMFGVLVTSCKKPDCVKPEYPAEEGSCAGEHEVSAEFDVRQAMAGGNAFVPSWIHPVGEEGMFLVTSLARFVALEDDASYSWTIGAGEYDAQFGNLSFSDDDIGSIIPVTLIVDKMPNLECFPEDDGADTLTKFVKVIEHCDVPTLGLYRGAWLRSPMDTFELEITFQDTSGIDPYGTCFANDQAYLIGFSGDSNNLNDTLYTYTFKPYARYAAFESAATNDNDHQGYAGELWLDENLVDVVVKYNAIKILSDATNEIEHYTFVGKKIN